MRAGQGHIEDRRAVRVDSECGQIIRCQSGHGQRCAAGGFDIPATMCEIGSGGWQKAGQRRLQALHASALLIDQHEHILGSGRDLELRDESADLRGVGAIAGEQDQSCRTLGSNESAFVGGHFVAGQTGDESLLHTMPIPNRSRRVNALAGNTFDQNELCCVRSW